MDPPVFVFGALRSGTTLFRLMLDAHPRIANPGEVDFLFDRIEGDPSSTGWCYDLDGLAMDRIFRAQSLAVPDGVQGRKLLDGFVTQLRERVGDAVLTVNVHRHAERWARLFPSARVIHVLRDPRDVAQSSIGMGWAMMPYFGVAHWIGTEKEWEGAKLHLRPENILELTYEALVRQPEIELRRTCDFLGVDYNSEMLDYHLSSTYEPVNAGLAEQWRRKQTPRAVGLVEGRLGAMLSNRGYAPSGHPVLRPSRLEHAWLSLRNYIGCKAYLVRRYGSALLLRRKLGEWLGLERMRRSALLEMQNVDIRHLK